MNIELAIAVLRKTVDLMEDGFCIFENPFGLYDGETFLDCDQLYYEYLIDEACTYHPWLETMDASIEKEALGRLMKSFDHRKLISQAASVVNDFIKKQKSDWAE